MENEKKMVFEPLKKKMGRPKKAQASPAKPKGKRGRPKKVVDAITLNQPAPPKNKRGRPKKQEVSPAKPKGKRGRPKKYYDIKTNQLVTPKPENESKAKELFNILHNTREGKAVLETVAKVVTQRVKATLLKSLLDS